MSEQMPENWEKWASALGKWGLQSLAAWLLEAARPLHLVGAQLVYLSQPALSLFLPQARLAEVARLLEEPEQAAGFIEFLRGGHAA
jgi:hypothetical protein